MIRVFWGFWLPLFLRSTFQNRSGRSWLRSSLCVDRRAGAGREGGFVKKTFGCRSYRSMSPSKGKWLVADTRRPMETIFPPLGNSFPDGEKRALKRKTEGFPRALAFPSTEISFCREGKTFRRKGRALGGALVLALRGEDSPLSKSGSVLRPLLSSLEELLRRY